MRSESMEYWAEDRGVVESVAHALGFSGEVAVVAVRPARKHLVSIRPVKYPYTQWVEVQWVAEVDGTRWRSLSLRRRALATVRAFDRLPAALKENVVLARTP